MGDLKLFSTPKEPIWKWPLLQDWHWLVQPENTKCIETTKNSRLKLSRIFSMVNSGQIFQKECSTFSSCKDIHVSTSEKSMLPAQTGFPGHLSSYYRLQTHNDCLRVWCRRMQGVCCSTARGRMHGSARAYMCLGEAAAKHISARLLTATVTFKAS